MQSQLAEPERYAQFLARDDDGAALGLAEASIRQDYVNGTDGSPVGFLEGLYVVPAARRQGVSRALVDAVAAWARSRGCAELASDTALDNLAGQALHERLGFEETERVVFYRRSLAGLPASAALAGEPAPNPLHEVQAVCFDWGGTLMSEQGPADTPMGLWPQVQALPGAAEALALLAGRLPLAIATNATVSRRPMIELALRRVGLGRHFADVFCFTELGHRKNEPEFWDAVERRLGVPRERIAMVGDSLEHDVRAPRRFGVQAVWLNPAGAAATDGDEVPAVADLPAFARWVILAS
ncbi:putative aminoglycoside 6'-N-acetyltransferase/phosphoglycolate phosphatase [Rubrivivax gelatinosus IL144]|uniref:Putative aminoglycoside 6'-N-acetyltransferase/phosphoglycolate phosphatase n=2 Tax=Rubrivivax gelatinosus TaxID=28068 RepID=I0HLU9_RUBGI|nr:putative aminoglycoside 6'-N-acetyltransferase/phosphoglycolate phosphatase [Rubrivivax gelatinosus IL144]